MGIVVLVFTKSVDKNEKNILIKNVTYISRNFFYNLQTFRGFWQVHFYGFLANSAWKYPISSHILQGSPLRQENLKGTACFSFLFRPMDTLFYRHGLLKSLIQLFKPRRNNSIQLQSDHVTVPNSIYSGLFLGISNFSKTI